MSEKENLTVVQEEINQVLEKYNISYSDAYTLLSFMAHGIMQQMHKGK